MEQSLHIDKRLVRELGPGLLSFAQRTVGDRAVAEDLVQEMWLGALRSAGRFEGRSSVRTWLTTILRRRIAERYRRGHVHEAFDEDEVLLELDDVDPLVAQEEARQARQLLSELDGREQLALTLCTIEDVDRDEVCAQLGVTRGHLRVLLHRASQKARLSAERSAL